MKKIMLIIILTLPAVWALLKPGFFPSHDGKWMVVRLSAFHQSLRDGQFPVRWSGRLNHGYGYPVLNFLYPLPFYFGEIFYLTTRSFTAATKLVFILSYLSSAITMYLWLKNRLSTLAALAGSVLYVYTPYRFVDTYVRGSIGESLGFVFIPLIFLAIDLLPNKTRFAVILGALSAAATVLAHNVFAIFLGIALIYGLATLPKSKIPFLVILFTLGAMLSAYFWLPAITEIKYVRASQMIVANPVEHLATIKDLIIPRWEYGPSNPGDATSMSFQIGLVNLVVIVLIILTIKKSIQPKSIWIWLVSFLASSLLMHKISQFVWQTIPGLPVIQYPWRLLAVTTFTTAVLAAILVSKRKSALWGLAIIIAAILATTSYAVPQSYTTVPDSFYSTNDDSTTIRLEYLPVWVNNPPLELTLDRVTFISGRGVISQFTQTNNQIGFRVEASEDASIKLAAIYYPGWQVTINGKPTPIKYQENNGMITLDVSKGISQVSAAWGETSLRETANFISLSTLLLIISHVFCVGFWQTASMPLPTKKLKTRN